MLNHENIASHYAHSSKLHVWGCFAASGMGEMYTFTDNLDAPLLKEILSECLLQSAESLFDEGEWWFLQDNAPTHSSQLFKDYLFAKGVQCMEWAPYSPDLNPIENLWAYIKRQIEKR